jgi:MraZ protein
MFLTGQSTKVDDKGRLKLSAENKAIIDQGCGPKFYITTMDVKRVQIYPLQEWLKRMEALNALPTSNLTRQRILNVNARYGQQIDMDGAGRLLLPQALREDAKLTGDVQVVAQLTHLEVANAVEFLEGAQPMSPEEVAQAAALGF